MRRTGWLLGVVLLSFVPATAAISGGLDSLNFERRYYSPGQSARASARVWTEAASVEADGPFHAYLLSEGEDLRPPDIPGSAIPLGPLNVTGIPDEANAARVSLAFAVPDVPPGTYYVDLCNRPCRDDIIAGSLTGNWIDVVATADEARLLNFGDKLERRLDRRLFDQLDGIWTDMGSLRDDMSAMDARISGVAIQGRRGETVDADLTSRLGRAESELVAMERRITDLASRPGWPSSPLHWVVLASGWLATLAVASLWVRSAFRARRPLATREEHTLDLGELNPQDQNEERPLAESAGDWWARTGPAPSMTAASRRAMSLAGNGRKV